MNKISVLLGAALFFTKLFGPPENRSALRSGSTTSPARIAKRAFFSADHGSVVTQTRVYSPDAPDYSHLDEPVGQFVEELYQVLDQLQISALERILELDEQGAQKINDQITKVIELIDFLDQEDEEEIHPFDKEALMLKIRNFVGSETFAEVCLQVWSEYKKEQAITNFLAQKVVNRKKITANIQALAILQAELLTLQTSIEKLKHNQSLFPVGQKSPITDTQIIHVGEQITRVQAQIRKTMVILEKLQRIIELTRDMEAQENAMLEQAELMT